MLFASAMKRWHCIWAIVAATVLAGPFLYYRFVLRLRLGFGSGAVFRKVFIECSLEFLWSDIIGFIFSANLLYSRPYSHSFLSPRSGR